MTNNQQKHIWSFDIGTGSLGYAVRGAKGDPFEFNKVDSLLIPDKFASTKSAAERRRAYRSRLAHKKREEWLRKVFREAGLETLNGAKIVSSEGKEKLKSGDERLEREFPAKDDDTVYCGTLLQIMLLQGKKLEEWQLYKAFHSAIQKRGFDKDAPWKSALLFADKDDAKSKEENKEKTETAKRAACIQKEIENISKISKNANHRHPCYWEAYRMGLWNPKSPDSCKLRIDHTAKSTHVGKTKDPIARERLDKEGGKTKEDAKWLPPTMAVYPRHMIEKQLRCMFKQAEKQYPALTGKEDYLLYGPTGEAYASYHAERGNPELYEKAGGRKALLRGKETDWQGILAQKIPTFDNRSPNKCALIPRFNACRAAPKGTHGNISEDSLLSAQVTFLMKLKNIRFIAGEETKPFAYEEIRAIFNERMDAVHANVRDRLEKKITKKLSLTKKDLEKYIHKYGGDCVAPNNGKVDAPKIFGRSRFSRPALRIVKDLILSGKSPQDFLRENEMRLIAGNFDKRKGLVKEDLAFMEHMGNSWDGLYIPNQTLSEYKTAGGEGEQAKAIQKLIADQNDPIVRHRLGVFYSQIKNMQREFGTPDRVAIEFVREDWLPEQRKNDYEKHKEEREQRDKEAQKELEEKWISPSQKNLLKWQLWKEQEERCIFCDRPITLSESYDLPDAILFEEAEITPIVPDSNGGPCAYMNLVLASKECKRKQGDRLPSDWLKREGKWGAFIERLHEMVKGRGKKFPKFKAALLSATNMEDAAKAVNHRVGLRQTAWIAKLTQAIVRLHFGWNADFDGEERKVAVLGRGATNAVAQKYKLLELLHEGANAEKNINDNRRHALDAMILSFIPNWARGSDRRLCFSLPAEALRADPQKFFGAVLERVMPRQICFNKPIFRETVYGKRNIANGEEQATYRVPLDSLGDTSKGQWDGLAKTKKDVTRIYDADIRKKVEKWVNRRKKMTEQQWRKYCKNFQLSKDTPAVKKVRVADGDITNYKDISRGQFGQFKTRKESDQGQFLYLDSKNKVRVKPVRVFESRYAIGKELESNPGIQKVLGFFHSKCLIEVTETILMEKQKEISAGIYTLNTIEFAGKIEMTSAKGEKRRIALKHFLKEEPYRKEKRFVLRKTKA